MTKPKRALFCGRFQPFHLGHDYLFNQKLSAGIPLLIAVRDIEPDENNPLTAEQSAGIITARYLLDDVKVIIIDDIESINWGRGVGYQLNEIPVPPSIAQISATQIRKLIRDKDESWKSYIHPSIRMDIERLFS